MHSSPTIAGELGRMGAIQRAQRQPATLPEFKAPANLQELQAIVADALVQVRAGSLQPKAGNAVAILASTLTQIMRATELRDRVLNLERWYEQERQRRTQQWTT